MRIGYGKAIQHIPGDDGGFVLAFVNQSGGVLLYDINNRLTFLGHRQVIELAIPGVAVRGRCLFDFVGAVIVGFTIQFHTSDSFRTPLIDTLRGTPYILKQFDGNLCGPEAIHIAHVIPLFGNGNLCGARCQTVSHANKLGISRIVAIQLDSLGVIGGGVAGHGLFHHFVGDFYAVFVIDRQVGPGFRPGLVSGQCDSFNAGADILAAHHFVQVEGDTRRPQTCQIITVIPDLLDGEGVGHGLVFNRQDTIGGVVNSILSTGHACCQVVNYVKHLARAVAQLNPTDNGNDTRTIVSGADSDGVYVAIRFVTGGRRLFGQGKAICGRRGRRTGHGLTQVNVRYAISICGIRA